jgi:protease-4
MMDKKSTPSFSEILKNIFFVIVILQLTPPILQSIFKQYKNFFLPQTKVGVLTISGILYNSESYSKKMRLFFQAKEIKAILIKMECSGGASGSSQTLYDELSALKKEYPKPVVVLVENICASGGYNIACAADYIIAPGSAIIGSIGTTMPYLFSFKELMEKFNIKYTPIAAGSFKNITNPFINMSEQEKTLLQGVADDSYDQFIRTVSTTRKLAFETSKEWADGKIFTGRQAKTIGLIDEVGSLDTAIQILKKKAHLEGEIEWIYPPHKVSFWNMFSDDGEQDGSMVTSLAGNLGTYLQQHFASHTIA